MTNTGQNSWTFSREYSDGEDNITITLQSENAGRLSNAGSLINEDDLSDRTDFDFTCDVTKRADESLSPDEPGEPVEYVDWIKFSGTWIPDSEIGSISLFDRINYPEDDAKMIEFNLDSAYSTNLSISITETANEGEYYVNLSGTVVFAKTSEGYTCSRNTYDISEASAVYVTSSEYQGLHMKNMTSSGLLASIYEWDDNTIDIIFIDELLYSLMNITQ